MISPLINISDLHMEKSIACVFVRSGKDQFKELLKLLDSSPDCTKELSNQLSLILSVYSSIDNEVLEDFILLCERILRNADDDPKLLFIICIFRIFPLKTYRTKKLVTLIEQAYDSLKIVLETNRELKSFANPIYKLSLDQAKKYYANTLHYKKPSDTPHTSIKEILKLLIIRKDIKKQDLLLMNIERSIKEWIGYLYLLKDIANVPILLKQLKCFLFKVLPSVNNIRPKVFEWVNDLIHYLSVHVLENKTKTLIMKYEDLYGNNEESKNINRERLASTKITKDKDNSNSGQAIKDTHHNKGNGNRTKGRMSGDENKNVKCNKVDMVREDSTALASKSNFEESKRPDTIEDYSKENQKLLLTSINI